MSLMDYEQSKEITMRDYSFKALIMAAFRKADTDNYHRLEKVFPIVANEIKLRYNSPGGVLPNETVR